MATLVLLPAATGAGFIPANLHSEKRFYSRQSKVGSGEESLDESSAFSAEKRPEQIDLS